MHPIPLAAAFNEQFIGMTVKETTVQLLEETRKIFLQEINNKLTDNTAVPLTCLSSRPEGEILFYCGLRSLTFVRDDSIGIVNTHVSIA